MVRPNTSDMIRRREVMALTGWPKKYIDKLRESKTLRAWRPCAGSQWWYFRSEVLDLISPSPSSKNK